MKYVPKIQKLSKMYSISTKNNNEIMKTFEKIVQNNQF